MPSALPRVWPPQHKSVLVCLVGSALLMVISPVLLSWDWFLGHFPLPAGDDPQAAGTARRIDVMDSLLVLASGLTNLVAISAIARAKELAGPSGNQPTKPEDEQVRHVLIVQLALLATIVGFDLSKILVGALPVLCGCLALIGMMVYLYRTNSSAEQRTGWLIFGVVALAGLAFVPNVVQLLSATVRARIDTLSDASWAKICLDFVSERLHAYTHLLFIPAIYLFGDLRNRDYLPTSKRALALDVQIAVTGVAVLFAGMALRIPSFEAGSSAVLLLIGNWAYVSYVAD